MLINKILVVDDEDLIRKFLCEALLRKNFEIEIAENGKVAIDILKKKNFDLIITDMMMPKKSGLEVLKFTKQKSPHTLVIIITAFGSIENAVEAMKLGAFHYLIKPFSLEALETIIEKAKTHINLVKENQYLKSFSSERPSIVAYSKSMKKILSDIEKVARTTSSVFISGESGTGKEVIAHAIHTTSPRWSCPFIKVNCAAIPESLIESEFFGHEKGAFTGADNKREGRFELAHRGTLLLDEVTEIPLTLQPKLLRAIQEKEFERVGGSLPIKVDVRLLATSNRNMKEVIKTNIFREDLYFRLNVVPIYIPPLRERKEDILPLAEHFLQHFCQENHKPKKSMTPSAKEKLLGYSWPGNVRELANIIERAVVMNFTKEIKSEHIYLDSSTLHPQKKIDEITCGSSLKKMEKHLILETLKATNYNRTQAANILQISVRTLRNKINQYKSDQKHQDTSQLSL